MPADPSPAAPEEIIRYWLALEELRKCHQKIFGQTDPKPHPFFTEHPA